MKTSVNFPRVVLAAIAAVIVVVGAMFYYGLIPTGQSYRPANSIMVLAPYRYNGTWVFDDPAVGLVREPFVGGAPEMIDELVAGVPDAEAGFRLTFSATEFPGYQKKLVWLRGGQQGNWYRLEGTEQECWLCPALFKYYRQAPKKFYVRADPKE
ncbi:MAG: hypothetical protein JW959_14370 [Pirellulales bacterium]|nr:hypothetical protein [Pirellulales bacterium]